MSHIRRGCMLTATSLTEKSTRAFITTPCRKRQRAARHTVWSCYTKRCSHLATRLWQVGVAAGRRRVLEYTCTHVAYVQLCKESHCLALGHRETCDDLHVKTHRAARSPAAPRQMPSPAHHCVQYCAIANCMPWRRAVLYMDAHTAQENTTATKCCSTHSSTAPFEGNDAKQQIISVSCSMDHSHTISIRR